MWDVFGVFGMWMCYFKYRWNEEYLRDEMPCGVHRANRWVVAGLGTVEYE
mgnify:CR=1 FL=1